MKPIDHQALYSDPNSYDLILSQVADIPFYLKMASQYGGPCLELACGTGRVSIPLAEAGYKVTGIDISEEMLELGKIKAQKSNVQIDWVLGDIRTFKLNKKFSLIYIPINSLCHLHDFESIVRCFESVKQHLNPDGRFIIDVFKPNFNILLREKGKRFEVMTYKNPNGQGDIQLSETNFYNEADQINYVKWYYNSADGEVIQELNMRMYFPQELDNYLRFAGFEIESKWGDYEGTPFDQDSSKQILIAKASTARS